MVDGLFNGSIGNIEAALAVRGLRHELLASNLANAQTPGYRALDVDFESTMRNVLDARESDAAPSRALRDALRVVAVDAPSIDGAMNTVDIDQQMARVEENALMYQVSARLANRRFQGLMRVIEEAGRR
jgi:flagellar basal-body rod protein FlgB